MASVSVGAGSKGKSVVGLAAFLAAVAVVAVAGSVAAGAAGEKYRALELPGFAPPSWLFGPVWTVLYVMIAVAGWLVWRNRGVGGWLWLYGVQLVLNGVWTPLFFAAELYVVALVDIVALLGLIVVLIVRVWGRERVAGWLLVPYLVWVGYATALNAAIVALN